MPTQSNFFDETPALDGPDYVALVIEWDELADDLERQIRADQQVVTPVPANRLRTIGLVAGGIVGVALLAFGIIHKLRA